MDLSPERSAGETAEIEVAEARVLINPPLTANEVFTLAHEVLGCEGCKWADPDAVRLRPCCTFADRLTIEGGGRGRCLTRQEVGRG